MENSRRKIVLTVISYILVAMLASVVTLALFGDRGPSKLEQLEALIQEKFIGEADLTAMEDAAAAGMIDALGDRWSYYISAADYQAHLEQKKNSYVGIGITISVREEENGFDILLVEPGSPAQEAGLLPGDILTHVQRQEAAPLGMDGTRDLVRGEKGTFVNIGVLRDGQTLYFDVERREIQVVVARGEMLTGNIGLVTIANFNSKCADESIAAIESLIEQGAQALIFDVRNNPGGYKKELVDLLDYLLPEGPLFRSVEYNGKEEVDQSDASCLEMPMAVLVNGNSYSAAEFFAAALEEYDWATVVGDPTCGKSYYQYTMKLNDGSAVALSMGKYLTPNGVSLAEVGGLVPEIVVEVDDETAAMIYAQLLPYEEDTQLQAAVKALQ